MVVEGKSYDCCSACSEKVLQAYERDGWKFVEKALRERDYVEELSGLKEVRNDAVVDLQKKPLRFCLKADSCNSFCFRFNDAQKRRLRR